MNLKRTGKTGFVFQLSTREKQILFETIKLYPLVPATHHRLSKTAGDQSEENQWLLDESLAEQRTANRRQLEALLKDPARFKKSGSNFRLQLKAAEMEWLLQVFNDIRVGSWLALGEPDEDKPPAITPENFRYAVALEVCGAFQSVILAALGEAESPEWLG
ncbi:MAG: hypothetical protein H8M99_00605 [Gloeobacteraceae cyanobacterium ES-bin-144]|nr:hypothetical protein [Verrucomicrobiales bacterium]